MFPTSAIDQKLYTVEKRTKKALHSNVLKYVVALLFHLFANDLNGKIREFFSLF